MCECGTQRKGTQRGREMEKVRSKRERDNNEIDRKNERLGWGETIQNKWAPPGTHIKTKSNPISKISSPQGEITKIPSFQKSVNKYQDRLLQNQPKILAISRPETIHFPFNGTLVVKLQISNAIVGRVLIDNG